MSNARRWTAALAIAISLVAAARAETLRGNVTVEDGSPARGTRVWAARLWTHALERVETTADDRGRFSVELEPGDWLIEAGFRGQGVGGQERTKVEEGQPLEPMTIRLSPRGRLRGRLIDAATGQQYRFAHVNLASPNGGRITATVQPGGQGKFCIGEIPEGAYRFSITSESNANLHHEQLKLQPGDEVSRTLRVAP